MSDPTKLRLCAAALDAGLKKTYGPTHPQAGKFTPEFLASCGKHLTEAADRIETLEQCRKLDEQTIENQRQQMKGDREAHYELTRIRGLETEELRAALEKSRERERVLRHELFSARGYFTDEDGEPCGVAAGDAADIVAALDKALAATTTESSPTPST